MIRSKSFYFRTQTVTRKRINNIKHFILFIQFNHISSFIVKQKLLTEQTANISTDNIDYYATSRRMYIQISVIDSKQKFTFILLSNFQLSHSIVSFYKILITIIRCIHLNTEIISKSDGQLFNYYILEWLPELQESIFFLSNIISVRYSSEKSIFTVISRILRNLFESLNNNY